MLWNIKNEHQPINSSKIQKRQEHFSTRSVKPVFPDSKTRQRQYKKTINKYSLHKCKNLQQNSSKSIQQHIERTINYDEIIFPKIWSRTIICMRTCMFGCFSRVWLFVTLWTVVHQAPLSMGFPSENPGMGFMPSSRRSSWPRNQTHSSYVSCIGRWVLYH